MQAQNVDQYQFPLMDFQQQQNFQPPTQGNINSAEDAMAFLRFRQTQPAPVQQAPPPPQQQQQPYCMPPQEQRANEETAVVYLGESVRSCINKAWFAVVYGYSVP